MSEPQLTADFGAVLDANVLANFALCDLLLRLAETPRLYTPFFSDEILKETKRTLVGKLGWPPEIAEGLVSELRAHFPESLVTYLSAGIAEGLQQRPERPPRACGNRAVQIRGDRDV